MRIIKKIAIIAGCLVILLIIINVFAGWYIEKKLPEAIQSDKDFPYNFSYKDADVSFLTGSITLHEAYIAPKDSLSGDMNKGAFGKIKAIEVNRFNAWALLFDNHIKVKEIIIDTPEIILYPREDKYDTQEDFVKPFKKSITTKTLKIKNGAFRMLDTLHNFIAKANNISFELNNINVDSTSMEKDIPLRYSDYKLSCDSLYYHAGRYYDITAKSLSTDDESLSVELLKLVPLQSRADFNSAIPSELDQFTITAQKIDIPKNDWGFINDTLYFHSPEVSLDRVDVGVYRGKMVKDDLSVKKLYSQLLRELDFDLLIDKITLKDCNIVYEEQASYDRKPGKVILSNFYASVYNVYSLVRKDKFPETKIDVKCTFMQAAPLAVNWTFNIPDRSDAFTVTGSIGHIKTEQINPLSSALMNVKTSGEINQIKFTMHGNKANAKGTFAINYSGLKVEVLEKDGKGKKGLVSLLGNLIVKNDSDGSGLEETPVGIDRPKTQSVFNFIWKFNQEGLKQTLLKGVFKNVAKAKS